MNRPRIGAWRLWSLQGSWNRQGMQRLGWVVVWAPWLRDRFPDASSRARWLAEEPTSSNTNPYVAGLLLGARMRVEEEHGPAAARRVTQALARTLGALGDGWTWAGLRPLLALAVLLAAPWLGVWAALAAWLLFAVGQAWLRRWSLEQGYARGEAIVDLVADPRLHRGQRAVRVTGSMLAGATCVLVASGRSYGSFDPSIALAGGAALGVGLAALRLRWRPEWVLWGSVVALALLARSWTAVTGGTWTWP